jgi:hypothetical protein
MNAWRVMGGHTSNSISNLVKPPNFGSSCFGSGGGEDCVPVIETSLDCDSPSVVMFSQLLVKVLFVLPKVVEQQG